MKVSAPLALFTAIGLLVAATASLRPQEPVSVHVHADRAAAPYTPLWNYFGADEPNYIYAPNGQKLLGELAQLSPVPVYFRTHNLFTTGDGQGSLKWGSTNVYTEKPDGTPVYDFTITDRIYDALTAAHVRPLVEIGFMPQALSTHPEPYRHNFPQGDIFTGWSYPPKDEAKWSALVKAYAAHLHERYGAQVDTWLWEVWNEPDIAYWHGTPAEYDRLYDLSAAAIRSVLPSARIGGPEATGVSDHSEPFLRQFLEHCAHGKNAATGGTGAPLDFISYHPKGAPKYVDGHIVMSVGTQLRAVDRGMQVIASYPEWRHTPIILGESDPEGCGACKDANGYRNTPLYGASVTEATMRTYELARRYGLTVQGAVTWAFEFEDQPAFAGFRALATDGMDKPVLNAFRLLGMLSTAPHAGSEKDRLAQWLEVEDNGRQSLDEVVANGVHFDPDIDAVATRSGGQVNVLVWNYHDSDSPAEPADVHVSVSGLAGRQALVRQFRVDATHGNSYAAWKAIGSPAHPLPEQVAQIEKTSRLQPALNTRAIQDGKVALDLTIPRQGIVLIQIKQQ